MVVGSDRTTTAGPAVAVVDGEVIEPTTTPEESVVITAELANTGNTVGSDPVELWVDGRLVATKGVRLDPGETTVVTFERSFDRPGDHEIAVGDRSLPTVSVAATDAGAGETHQARSTAGASTANRSVTDAPNVTVVGTRGLADWVRSGYNASLGVTLVNHGDRTTAYTLRVAVDDRTVATESVRLPPGRTNVSVEFLAVAGTVRVGGTRAGTLSVADSWNVAEDDDRATTAGDGPGFGAGVAALAVAAVVLWRLRAVRRVD